MFQRQSFSLLPPVIKNLLIINGLAYFASIVFAQMGIDLLSMFGLYLPQSSEFQPYQLVTHLFFHDLSNLSHIFGNMFALWMFGVSLENLWGSQRFFIFYFVTGLGAALCHLGVNMFEYYRYLNEYQVMGNFQSGQMAQMLLFIPTVGASGAVFGLLLGFGMTYPNQRIYIYFLMPIKAKYFVLFYGAFELFSGFSNPGSNIAHFAHIGGMLFGFLLLRYWKQKQFRRY
ncbi:rhomboid family intramembrane serine protease [Schleiferiaceae bacterium]|jgi:membrane associated rhomboid family serine protease|nr:rhomboid family intramembrane serine protease [Schleiferiaceae bacterium]MDC3353719.1 rhomboid family intramembrane serine protease [Schleiferiaceae bacterium]